MNNFDNGNNVANNFSMNNKEYNLYVDNDFVKYSLNGFKELSNNDGVVANNSVNNNNEDSASTSLENEKRVDSILNKENKTESSNDTLLGENTVLISSDPVQVDDEATDVLASDVKTEYEIVLTNSQNSERVFSGIFDEYITIGRNSAKSELVISDEKSISGLHCKISFENGQYFVEDLNSSNGTVLNGAKIVEKTTIKNGDVIKLGREEFDLVLKEKEN